jgi:hypothetical protein
MPSEVVVCPALLNNIPIPVAYAYCTANPIVVPGAISIDDPMLHGVMLPWPTPVTVQVPGDVQPLVVVWKPLAVPDLVKSETVF